MCVDFRFRRAARLSLSAFPFSFPLEPETVVARGRSSDLFPRRTSFPFPAGNSGLSLVRQVNGTHSRGFCPGLSPGSLFIPTDGRPPEHRLPFVRKYTSFRRQNQQIRPKLFPGLARKKSLTHNRRCAPKEEGALIGWLAALPGLSPPKKEEGVS